MKKILIIISIILGTAAVSVGGTEAGFKSGLPKLPNLPIATTLARAVTFPTLSNLPGLLNLTRLCPSASRPNLPHWPGCPPWPPPPPPPPPPETKLDLQIDIDGVIYEPLNGRPIFQAGDMKPGDSGEETLSFHVNEKACGFAKFKIKENLENGCNEPESLDDHSCQNPGPGKGELDEEVKWIIWKDEGKIKGWQCGANASCPEDPKEGDNILNGKEKIKGEGEIGDFDCDNDDDCDDNKIKIGEIEPLKPVYYGFAWCFGKWKKGMDCSGKKLDNETQTDSFLADLIFSAEPKKNNYDRGCPDPDDDGHDFDRDIDFDLPDFPDFPCGNLSNNGCFSEIEEFLRRD